MAITTVQLNLATGVMTVGGQEVTAIKNNRGDMTSVDVEYTDVGSAVVVKFQAQVADGVWKDRWQTPSTNTDDWHIPSKTTTLDDGSAGNAEAPIPLTADLGWRVAKVSGASSGTVTLYVDIR